MCKGISNLQIENALKSMNNEDIYDNFVPKQDIFFFDSFGLDSLKHFIIQDNWNVIEKIFFATEKMTSTDRKITLFNIGLTLILVKIYLLKSLMPWAIQRVSFFILFKLWTTSSNYIILKYMDGRR